MFQMVGNFQPSLAMCASLSVRPIRSSTIVHLFVWILAVYVKYETYVGVVSFIIGTYLDVI